MNFCGVRVDQQVFQEECAATNLIPDPPGCGAFDQAESEDLFDGWDMKKSDPPVKTVSIQNERRVRTRTKSSRRDLPLVSTYVTTIQPTKAALDSIEETIDDGRAQPDPEAFKVWKEDDDLEVEPPESVEQVLSSGSMTFKEAVLHTPPTTRLIIPTCVQTCSSISLNAMNTPDLLFCPTLDNSLVASLAPIDDILRRIEEGFRVRLVEAPSSSCCPAMEHVHLYLHRDRTRICLQAADDIEEHKDDALRFGVEMELHEIVRMEVGRHCRTRSFSLGVRKKPHSRALHYYDFEANSALERELILSTLMVLLDQACNNSIPPRFSGYFDGVGYNSSVKEYPRGTPDQPILCSPSLEQEGNIARQQEGQILLWEHGKQGHAEQESQTLSWEQVKSNRTIEGESPNLSWEHGKGSNLNEQGSQFLSWDNGSSYQLPGLGGDPIREIHEQNGRSSWSPRATDPDNEDQRAVASLSYHLENKLSVVSSWAIPEETLGGVPPSHVMVPQPWQAISPAPSGYLISPAPSGYELSIRDNVRLEQADSQMELKNNLSAQLLTSGAWCSDDVCTLALRDIADTCSGIFAMKQEDGKCRTVTCTAMEQPEMIEEYITTALGAPDAVYSCIMAEDVWNAEESEQRFTPSKQKSTSRRIQNRARRLNAQAARLRTLRNEMTFASALKKSKEKMKFIQTTQSFDERNHRSSKARHLIAAADTFHSSPLLKHILETMMLDEPKLKTELSEEVVEFYDSDPEDVRPRTLHERGPRRVAADRLNDENPSPKLRARGLDDIPTKKKLKTLDDDAVVDIVQTMSNERLTLMWHPTQDEHNPNRLPVCVKAFIEAGVYLVDGTFLLPKLTWTKESDPQNKVLHKIDLLDICRIRATESIDRKRYPFPSTPRSFYIETGTEIFLMEAQSSEERDRIVYGLKLVVARFASLLMLRDSRATDEFFGTLTGTVPGEAPGWAQGKGVGEGTSRSESYRRSKLRNTEGF